MLTLPFIFLSKPVSANPNVQVLLDLSLNSPIPAERTEEQVFAEAEAMIYREISTRYADQPDLSSIEITVLGNRHGDIIPILTTTVSRVDWQADPSVRTWSTYYRSYALFNRHTPRYPQPTVASRQPSSAANRRQRPSQGRAASGQVEGAYRASLPAPHTVQANLDLMD